MLRRFLFFPSNVIHECRDTEQNQYKNGNRIQISTVSIMPVINHDSGHGVGKNRRTQTNHGRLEPIITLATLPSKQSTIREADSG